MKKSFFLIAISIGFNCYSQTPDKNTAYPEVGKPCPDFELSHIDYYSQKHATLKDFKGKWLVLDFWNTHCGACIAGFPRTSDLQQEFGDKVQFILVGMEGANIDKEKQIRPLYERFRKAENLVMPCAFDSVVWRRFDIWTCPHTIIIDDSGIVKGITNYVTAADIRTFLSGGTPKLPQTYRYASEDIPDTQIPYDFRRPFLVDNNGAKDSDFIFRSVLTAFNPIIHHLAVPDHINEINIKTGRFEILGVPLYMLYNYAYYGEGTIGDDDTLRYDKYCDLPVLEMKDSSLFQYSYRYGKNIFSYSLIMPPGVASEEHFKESMQRDLQNYFGHNVHIEERETSYWRLVAKKGVVEKLKSKGGKPFCEFTHSSYSLRNFPIKRFLHDLHWIGRRMILDETEITGNIDITLRGDALDVWSDLKRSLEENGLELEEGIKKMEVMVIKDKIDTN